MADIPNSSLKDGTVTNAQIVNVPNTNVEKSGATKASLETSLSDGANGISARVISYTGNYVKVKWFKNNKPYGSWVTKNYVDTVKPLAALTTVKTKG